MRSHASRYRPHSGQRGTSRYERTYSVPMRWRGVLGLALVCCLLLAGSSSGEPTSAHVDFTAAGDYAMNASTTGAVLSALATRGSDAHLALGDLSYGTTGAEDDWCSFVKSRIGEGFPFELISGNHESNGINGNINDFSACMPNQLPGLVGTYGRQYYVDVPKVNPLVRFVMISPNLGFPNQGQYNYTAGSARYQWVSDSIDGARTDNIPWVVVGMHKPCLSMGEYSCDVGADLANLLISKKVDLVLTGHEHLYQRTKQLALGPGCTTLTIGSYNPSCVADSDSSLTKGAGTVFSTIGTGGIALRDVNLADPEAGYFVTSSGANQNPTYGFEDFDVTADKLTTTFVKGAGGTFTDSFTITRDANPPPNQPPAAAFTNTASGLTASFDATGSTDQDGTISSYAWSFGDGTTGTGSKPSHPYAAAGTYPVKLTVTDDDGATGTVTQNVMVSTPTNTVLASDNFARTVTSGWGTATPGGAWTLTGTASKFSVGGGAGKMQVPVTTKLSADLNSVSSSSTRVDTEFSVDKLIDANYVAITGRKIGANSYLARLRMQADGGAKLYLLRNSSDAVAAPVYTPSFTFVANAHYNLSMLVRGTSPTTVSAKVWKVGDPEPAAWQTTGTDNTAGFQAKGAVGVFSSLPSGAANAPVTVSFYKFVASDAN
jgi:PKD repeat protein